MAEPTDAIRASRAKWRYDGSERPEFADTVLAGAESVWDYPRPPRAEPDSRRIIVRAGTVIVADSRRAVRVLETASPPTVYLPAADVQTQHLVSAGAGSVCEWKGRAAYYDLVGPDLRVTGAAWAYPDPYPEFNWIRGYVSFYPALLDCSIDGVPVTAQPGGFYGGWVTPDIVGPFKGGPGSSDW